MSLQSLCFEQLQARSAPTRGPAVEAFWKPEAHAGVGTGDSSRLHPQRVVRVLAPVSRAVCSNRRRARCLVRELRTEGKSEATIAVVLGVAGRIYKYAARRLGWAGPIPTALMLASERPRVSQAKRRPIFDGTQLEQTIAAAAGPYRVMFTLAALTGGRISELCGLTWANVRLDDLADAEVEFGWQVDRKGNRRPTIRMARRVPSRSRASWRSSSLATSSLAATPDPSRTCSRRALVDRSVSATSRAHSERHRSEPAMNTDARHSRSCTSATSADSPWRSRSRHSPRCARFATRSQAARCWPASLWMRSRSSLDTAMETSRALCTCARWQMRAAERCDARG